MENHAHAYAPGPLAMARFVFGICTRAAAWQLEVDLEEANPGRRRGCGKKGCCNPGQLKARRKRQNDYRHQHTPAWAHTELRQPGKQPRQERDGQKAAGQPRAPPRPRKRRTKPACLSNVSWQLLDTHQYSREHEHYKEAKRERDAPCKLRGFGWRPPLSTTDFEHTVVFIPWFIRPAFGFIAGPFGAMQAEMTDGSGMRNEVKEEGC